MKKLIAVVVIVGVGALVAFRLYEETGAAAADTGDSRGATASVETGAVVERMVRESVTAVGSLRALEMVEVMPKEGGRVLERLVDLGDVVRVGDLIARLDDDVIRQQVEQATATLNVSRAQVQQRQAELANIEVELARSHGLFEQGLVSSQQLQQAETRTDVAEAQLAVARAQVTQSEAGLQALRIRLGYARVYAPISGVVGRRWVDAGALVNTSTPIVTIVNLEAMILVTNVSERDITKIRPGSAAQITVDALPKERFDGEVTRVAPLLDPQTRTGQVELHIANAGGNLKAEMFARATIDLSSERRALVVPRAALIYRGERSGVFVYDDGTARFISIETGTSMGEQVEVVAGLEAGQQVITRGANLIQDGDTVEVVAAAGVGGRD